MHLIDAVTEKIFMNVLNIRKIVSIIDLSYGTKQYSNGQLNKSSLTYWDNEIMDAPVVQQNRTSRYERGSPGFESLQAYKWGCSEEVITSLFQGGVCGALPHFPTFVSKITKDSLIYERYFSHRRYMLSWSNG